MTESIYNNAGMPSEQGAAPEIPEGLREQYRMCVEFLAHPGDPSDKPIEWCVQFIERIAAVTLERDTLKAENEELNKVGTEVWTENLIAEVAALKAERDERAEQVRRYDKAIGVLTEDNAALKAKVERLSAPVSDAEWYGHSYWPESGGVRGFVDNFIAARASTPPAHPINDDEQRRKDAAWNDRPKARCVCGEMIAWYSGEWLHVAGRSGYCADGRLASPAHFLVGMPSAEPEWQKEQP